MAGVAQLKAVLGMDTRGYRAGARDIKRRNESIRKSFAQIGAALGVSFSLSALVSVGRELKRWADAASIAARNVGVTTSEMIGLNRVAIQSGIGINEMQRMLAKMQQELLRAAEGEEMSIEKFERMGLEIEKLVRMDPASMLQEVSRAAFESEIPLTTLAELFGERLGPNAVVALRAIANDGLPEVDEAIGQTADNIEALGSAYEREIDKMKAATVGLAAKLDEAGLILYDVGERFIKGTLGGENVFKAIGESVKQASDNMDLRAERRAAKAKKREEQRRAAAEETARVFEKTKQQESTDSTGGGLSVQLDRLREQAKSKAASVRGRGVGADQMVRYGGMLGGSRPQLAAMDKQLKVLQQNMDYARQMTQLLQDQSDALQVIAVGGRS